MINELKNDIEKRNVNHAYFLECNDENKAIEEAKEFASLILGKDTKNNPDCTVFLTEEKSIKVESIRELQKDIAIKPLMCSKKVYIIPYAEKMNVSAQNCLLKTLEEPPLYAVIILISSSIYSVINTIRSRVKRIKIKTADGIYIDPEIKNIIDSIPEKSVIDVLKFSEFFEKNKDKIIEIFHEMLKYCDELIMNDKNRLPVGGNSDIISVAKYVPIIDLAEHRINGNCNFSMAIDEMLLSFKDC